MQLFQQKDLVDTGGHWGFAKMKIVIAPDSFKESLTAFEAARQLEAGFREIFPEAEYHLLPIADGGEGTVEAMVAATGGEIVRLQVSGPLGEQVGAFYGITGDRQTAVIEMAAASGLGLVPTELRNPLLTTSRGTGELIRHALDAGLRHFIVGIGGSATNDAGAGMLQALGVQLTDREGREIGAGGGALGRLAQIDVSRMDPRLKEARIEVACDVDNPLLGPQGASAVFAPQKGAGRDMVAQLDANLAHFADLVARELKVEMADIPGSGAAGGMGAALRAFLGADLQPGIGIISKAVGLEQAIRGADLVITAEGRIDGQTAHGKAPLGVARIAVRHGVPVIGIAGSLGPGAESVHQHGIAALFSVLKAPCSLPEALAAAADNLHMTARNVAAVIKLAKHIGNQENEQLSGLNMPFSSLWAEKD